MRPHTTLLATVFYLLTIIGMGAFTLIILSKIGRVIELLEALQ